MSLMRKYIENVHKTTIKRKSRALIKKTDRTYF